MVYIEWWIETETTDWDGRLRRRITLEFETRDKEWRLRLETEIGDKTGVRDCHVNGWFIREKH